ncbi:STAS domain-containing protein [Solirubrobacter sp. CPCC 204708]|uniref:STAS domain-containing protein n=1 Tax=Solirubrobacter deserti TaxID=2282478 RepID=A0ABT4RCN8_9ACTN|nr:STAS domain-containing protein [Solirubrobacter deserti]MBE2315653.1 STAS domain-containing protein [Solirubrobacter deserti]MDA0136293.1 STAS domain-containing protein [Solirubrobacter deserti]
MAASNTSLRRSVVWMTGAYPTGGPWVPSSRVPDPRIIAPPAELDIATVDEFRVALADALSDGADGLVIDLSEVKFIDSTGLSAILHAQSKLKRDGRRMAIVAPRGTAAAMLFTLSGLRHQLRIFDSTRAALRDHS